MDDGAARRRISLAAVAALGLVLGGWFGLHSGAHSTARGGAIIVRIDADAAPNWNDACITGRTKVAVPLTNSGSAPVTISSVTVTAAGSAGVPQPVSVSIAPSRSGAVEVALAPGANPTSCGFFSPIRGCKPTAEAVLLADFTVTQPSGRSETIRLPIGAWESNDSRLYPYSVAALGAWNYWETC